jgi:hypothetical protein
VIDPDDPDDLFVAPGTITVSAAALKLARDFITVVNGEHGRNWIAVIDWATSQTVKRAPDAVSESMGPGLGLGASKYKEIPPAAISKVDGFEFALQIPRHVWEKSARRVIDIDDKQLFKLALL